MKTERELFQEWFETIWLGIDLIQTIGEDYAFKFSGESYAEDVVNNHWKTWQAATQRDGFKLVPVELSDEIADRMAVAEWDKNKPILNSEYRDLSTYDFEQMRLRWCRIRAGKLQCTYKAMIGVCDE